MIKHPIFEIIVMIFIIGNVIVIAIDYDDSS